MERDQSSAVDRPVSPRGEYEHPAIKVLGTVQDLSAGGLTPIVSDDIQLIGSAS
jgi:hypothetical protein